MKYINGDQNDGKMISYDLKREKSSQSWKYILMCCEYLVI